jgi:inorganic pyrophosphatase
MSSSQHKAGGPWAELESEPSGADHGLVNVVIESPRASRCKYKFDEQHGLFQLHKLLPLGSSFPYDFGFIPSTLAEDGDPIDVLVLLEEPLFTGCVVPVRLIGVIEAEQTEPGSPTVRNDRLIGVVETAVNPAEPTSIGEIGEQVLREIEHFFVSYNEAEGRQFKCLGRRDAKHALELVDKARDRAKRSQSRKGSNGKSSSVAPHEKDQAAKSKGDSAADESGAGRGQSTDGENPPGKHKGGSFAIKPGRSFRKEIRRIVEAQLDKALRDLCRLGATADEAIHDVRKRFKRVRAVLRLVRGELGDQRYRKENDALRDAAAAFSEVRNARVLVDAVDKLRKRGGDVSSAAFDSLERFLKAKQRDTHERLARNVDAMDELREAIENGRHHASDWSLPSNGRRAIRRGLRSTCRAGCDALDDAERETTAEHLHECRKQAKYFFHQVQMLERVAPLAVLKLAEQLHELEQKLGDDHDLGMLRVEVAACIAGGLPDVTDRLLALTDGWRKELQDECLQQAKIIYREDAPKLRHDFRACAKQLSRKKH